MQLRRPLGLAIAALFALPAHALDFSNTYFFGDSLSDSGYYKPLLGAAGAVVGKFTTNPGPIWTENLAARFGKTAAPANTAGGTDYAQGGARVTQSPAIGVPTAFGTQPVATQMGAYLTAHGGKADPNALYGVWAGANDIFYAAQALGGNSSLIADYLLQTSAEQTAAVQALATAGARYIVVPNLPDMGATPAGVAQGAVASAGLTSMASNYNSLLYGQLAAKGVKVIPVDTFNMLREIQADPARYGLSNVTQPACTTASSLTCSPASLVQANAAQTYLFADGVHPSVATHKILSDYVYSILIAPSQIGLLAETPVRSRQALNETLLNQGEFAADSEGGTHLWAQLSGGSLNFDQSSNFAGADSSPYGVTIGLDAQGSRGGYGIALNVGRVSPDFSAGGNYSQREVSLNLYGGLRAGNWSINAAAGFGKLDYDTARVVTLGPTTRQVDGSTDGTSLSLVTQVAYNLGGGGLSHGPYAELSAQRVTVEAFNESSASGKSTAMAFGEQTRDAVFGQLGYRLAYVSGGISPYARVAVEHEFTDGERTVKASLPSASAGDFEMPAAVNVGSTAVNATVGAGFLLAKPLRAWVEANGSFGREDMNQYGLNVGMRYAF